MKEKLIGVDFSNGIDKTCKVYGTIEKGVTTITRIEFEDCGVDEE